jgi:hypothetical protein
MRENDDGKTVAAMDVLVPGVSFQTHASMMRLMPISPDSLIQSEWRWGADKAEIRVFLWRGCNCFHTFLNCLSHIPLGRLWLWSQANKVSGGGHSRVRLMNFPVVELDEWRPQRCPIGWLPLLGCHRSNEPSLTNCTILDVEIDAARRVAVCTFLCVLIV